MVGRRGARSTPLLFLLVALGACLAFLALSYWVSSSRGSELESRLAALDSEVRHSAAELSVAQLRKQQLQVQLQTQLESHREELEQLGQQRQELLQSAARDCTEEKDALNRNITSSTMIIHTLQEQFQQLQMGYSQLNQKLQELQKKLNYDITQCSNQIKDQKEMYEEQIKALYKKLVDATKSQVGKRNSEATDQNKLNEPKPTENQRVAKPSNASRSSKENNDHTNHLESNTNELAVSANNVQEHESDKLPNTSVVKKITGTIADNEIKSNVNPGVENDQHHLNSTREGNTDKINDASNVEENEKNSNSTIMNDTEVYMNPVYF
ncbi:Golgi membrane protein 1-like isoform X2 [Hypanus sabinus]|uniref:Golgi membrane protein 1-like isoform X2 n=1 Tax=Hypanus sabinus TaxID=79690 RepID=UPI0028C3D6AA|nr:Golgi membrane protein 1-like isoform X2 [Hypanus sabinus]